MRYLSRGTMIAAAVAVLAGCVIIPESFSGPAAASRSGAAQTRSLDGVAVGNNETVRLDAGTYEGRLVIEANNATVTGAGSGRTVLRATVIVNGNKNSVRGLTVIGDVRIAGNVNDLSDADLSQANVEARGNNNRY